MKQHLNTMFVTTDGAYLAKDGAAVVVKVGEEQALRVPMHNLGGIVCFGRISASPFLLGACAEAGVTVSFLTEHGRFLAKVQGFTPGNVLLRREQYRRADAAEGATAIARSVVAAKLANSRTVLLRAIRDYPDAPGREELVTTAAVLARCARQAHAAGSLDSLRGMEGDGADAYFGVFDRLLTTQREAFAFTGRSRRPPLDPINSLLSFLYAMMGHDARAALEAAGLDPAFGFLHRDRPGRPGLALDLIEEFRAFLADRLAVSLVNRRQVTGDGFRPADSGGVFMDDATRKTVIAAYQRRKQETIMHPFLREQTTIGLLVHLQARLLARHLRGDLDAYPAFIWH
jgi:CRISP-associated protein Cas1